MFIDYTANSGVITWLYCYLAMKCSKVDIIFGVLVNMSHTCMYSYSYNRKIACLHEVFGVHMDLTA